MELHEVERKIKELTLANWSLENSVQRLNDTVDAYVNNLEAMKRTVENIETELEGLKQHA